MKKYSLIVLIIVLFTISSCKDKISEVACKSTLEEINAVYDEQILEVESDPFLTQEQKDSRIANLNVSRDEDLALAQADCDALLDF